MKLIQLTRGKSVMVDDADFDWLNQWKWYARKSKRTFYAERNKYLGTYDGIKHRQSLMMHRVILGITDSDLMADHIDGNGLNCQRSNLRIVTIAQNNINKMGSGKYPYKGVCFHSKINKWSAQICHNGKHHRSPVFDTIEESARWYDSKAIELHGEFARLNFPAPK